MRGHSKEAGNSEDGSSKGNKMFSGDYLVSPRKVKFMHTQKSVIFGNEITEEAGEDSEGSDVDSIEDQLKKVTFDNKALVGIKPYKAD